MKFRLCILSLLLLLPGISIPLWATVWEAGPGLLYPAPSAVAGLVSDGDTVNITGALYQGDCVAWTADNLLLRAVGGPVYLEAAGNYVWGKGIWVCAGNNIRVDNIHFSGASVPDHNGAGIRLDGSGLHVRNCSFLFNENGILGGNSGTIRIENSEFGYNGYGDGYSHNIYINHADTLIIQGCYFHHANIGHEIKSRAHVNIIRYNRISNEETGNASREIDLPNGGLAILISNLIHQGPSATNGNMLGFGNEGLSNNPPHELYVIHNTFVDQRHFNGVFMSVENGIGKVAVKNSVFAGGPALWLAGNPQILDTAGNILIPDETLAGFAALEQYDYHLLSSSPALNLGTAPGMAGTIDLHPQYEYVHPLQLVNRPLAGLPDAGAYEYDPLNTPPEMHPEPNFLLSKPDENTWDIRWFRHSFSTAILRDAGGRELQRFTGLDSGTLRFHTGQYSRTMYLLQFIGNYEQLCIKIPAF